MIKTRLLVYAKSVSYFMALVIFSLRVSPISGFFSNSETEQYTPSADLTSLTPCYFYLKSLQVSSRLGSMFSANKEFKERY
jgi:hypothetical protein